MTRCARAAAGGVTLGMSRIETTRVRAPWEASPEGATPRQAAPFWDGPLGLDDLDRFARGEPMAMTSANGLQQRVLSRLKADWVHQSEALEAIEARKGVLGHVWHGIKRVLGTSGQSSSGLGRLWSHLFDSDLTRGACIETLQGQAQRLDHLERLARQGDTAGFDRVLGELTGHSLEGLQASGRLHDPAASLLSGGSSGRQLADYKASQRHGVDGLADLAVATITLASLPFILANPVSWLGVGVAVGVGATAKIALKLMDVLSAERHEYGFGQFASDAFTGAISGAGAGVGGWVASRWLGHLASSGSTLVRSPLRVATAYATADGATQGGVMSLNAYQYARQDGASVGDAVKQTLWAIPMGFGLGALGGAGVGAITGRLAQQAGHGPLGGGAHLVAQGEQNSVARLGPIAATPGEETLLIFNRKPNGVTRRQKLLELDAVPNDTPVARWTKDYVGGSRVMRETGHRWGIEVRSHEEALAKGLVKADGGLNLPAGRYLYVVKADGSLVLGRESRDVATHVVSALKQNPQRTDLHGLLLDGAEVPIEIRAHGGLKEILDVSNHSSLAGRGLPYDAANPDAFAIRAAGEIRVNAEGRILTQNDQTGQFTVNGSTVPPSNPAFGQNRVLESQQFNGPVALKYGYQRLGELTAQHDFDVNVIQFVQRDTLIPELLQPTPVTIRTEQAEAVVQHLRDPQLQAILNAGVLRPDEQRLLVAGLANPGPLDDINAVVGRLVEKNTLKAEPAARLKAALLKHPEALDLFRPDHPTAQALKAMKLSMNARRKLTLAVALHLQDDWVASRNGVTFNSLLTRLMDEPSLMTLLFQTGRPSRGVIRQALWDLDRAAPIASDILTLFKGKEKALERALSADFKALSGLRDIIKKAEAGKPDSRLAVLLRDQGVDVSRLYAFAKSEAAKRRGHEQILLGYALQDEAFAKLLKQAMATVRSGA